MLSELNWQLLAERRRHARLVMFYKIHYWLVSICIPLTSKFHLQSTRTENMFAYSIPSSSYDYHLQSFFPRTVRDWNTLRQEVVQLGTVKAFQGARLLECSLHLLCREPLFLICTLLFACRPCIVSCQHLVDWRSDYSLYCVCTPPTMY